MQKPAKVALGVATLWPVVYVFLFMAFFVSAIFFGPGPAETGSGAQPLMALFVGVHLLTMALILGLTIFYIVNIFRNERVEKDKKALWAIVIFMGSAIAMPIYWYLYIWKEAAPAFPAAPGQLGSADTSAWTNSTTAERQEEYVPPSEPPNWRD